MKHSIEPRYQEFEGFSSHFTHHFIVPISCIIGIFCVIWLIAIAFDDRREHPKLAIEKPIAILPNQWDAGNDQKIILVEIDQFKNWLNNAKDKEIISITILSYGEALPLRNNSAVSGAFLVVYKQLKSEAENGTR